MKKHSSTNDLDPLTVLRLIPEDWELKTPQYNLVSFLSSIFDNTMTLEENSKIGMNLSKMEQLNSEKEKNELQTAYMVITEDMLCKVCKSKLKHKNIRIFPHGQAFHMRCAKDPCECPVTR